MRHLDILFDPLFTFQRVANLSKSQRLQERFLEDTKLILLETRTLQDLSTTPSPPMMDSPTPHLLSSILSISVLQL